MLRVCPDSNLCRFERCVCAVHYLRVDLAEPACCQVRGVDEHCCVEHLRLARGGFEVGEEIGGFC